MIEARRQAYLEAMGIDVWIAKPPAPEPGLVQLGGGQGSTLLVCAHADDCGTPLARDIARALEGNPAWAWPDPGPGADSQNLVSAVEQNLFTRLVVFGESLARELFGKDIPNTLGSAVVKVASPMAELAVSGTARKQLWQHLSNAAGAA